MEFCCIICLTVLSVASPNCFADADRQPSLSTLPTKGTAPQRTAVEGPAVPDASKPRASTFSVDWPAPLKEQVYSVTNLRLEALYSPRMIRPLQELRGATSLFLLLSLLYEGFTEC